MATSPISPADLVRTLAFPRVGAWRSLTAGLRPRPVAEGRHAAISCFGTLPAKEQMVVKGLSAVLRCSPATGEQGW